MAVKPETRLRTTIKAALEQAGYYVIVNHGSVFSGSGRPDLTVDAHGTCVWIEVKTAGGTLTPRQKAEILKIRRRGGNAFVARSTGAALTGVNAARQGRLHMSVDDLEIDEFLESLGVGADDLLTDLPVRAEPDDVPDVTFVFEMPPAEDFVPKARITQQSDATSLPGGQSDLMTALGLEDNEPQPYTQPETDSTHDGIGLAVNIEPAPEAMIEKAIQIPRSRSSRPEGVLEALIWDVAALQDALNDLRAGVAKVLTMLGEDAGALAQRAETAPKRRGRPRKVAAE